MSGFKAKELENHQTILLNLPYLVHPTEPIARLAKHMISVHKKKPLGGKVTFVVFHSNVTVLYF